MRTVNAADASPVQHAPAARLPRAAARDIDAGSLLQLLLVSAVVSVLSTRLYLGLAGFPKLGGGNVHIAHLLWGGLLMLVALVLLLAVLGKFAKRVGAVVGGLGFGLFVDELGKFVTADNDYFFQPAVALIYVVFVVLFLAFRAIERRSLSHDELLVNAADMLREVVLGGATRAEIARARRLLSRSGFEGPLVDGLREAIAGATRVPERRSPLAAGAASAWRLYDHVLEWRWFQRGILLVFVVQAAGGLVATAAIGWLTLGAGAPLPIERFSLLSAFASLVLVLVGVVQIGRSRLAAYRWFERSVLVGIFLTQVVLFWQDQLTALGGLALDLLLLAGLRFMIRQEEARLAVAHDSATGRSATR